MNTLVTFKKYYCIIDLSFKSVVVTVVYPSNLAVLVAVHASSDVWMFAGGCCDHTVSSRFRLLSLNHHAPHMPCKISHNLDKILREAWLYHLFYESLRSI